MNREQRFMQAAIDIGLKGMRNNEGGPFGCVIVKNNEIVGQGHNKVVSTNDPTAHAEITAIRDACKNLNDFQLEDCEIFTSCEPCPMCLGAIYWARPKAIYYGNTRKDAADAGFDDSLIYNEISQPLDNRIIPIYSIGREQAKLMFEEWKIKNDKTAY